MGGESLRPYLKMQNLFCKDINKQVSPAVVRATLEKAAGPLCKVVIPLDYKTDQNTHIGQAYLNFASQAEAESCLEKIRFKLVFGKQKAKVMYAPGVSQSDKDRIWGPYSYKFQIIVKNLSEEVEVEQFYDFFSKFGDILQCKTDTDQYGQYFGQAQYLDTDSVTAAVDGANGTRWHSSVIQVVRHHKAAMAESTPSPRPSIDVSSSSSSFPALETSLTGGGSAAANTPTSARPPVYTQQLQQQQQKLQASVPSPALSNSPAPINFALQALGDSWASAQDSPVGRPLGAFSSAGGSSSNLHVGAPVVAPLVAPVAPPVAAPVSAPVVMPIVVPAVSGPPRLLQAELSGGSTGPGSATGVHGAFTPNMGSLSLLDRIARNRAEAASTSAAPPAGPEGPGVVQPAQDSSPSVVRTVGRANGNRKRGGLLKSLTQSLDQVSELLCCPITHEVFCDPVVAADGITYERHAIKDWLANHDTSPMTNIQLANQQLHPNNLVKTLIEELM